MTIEFKKASRYDVLIRHAANGGCVIKIGCCEAAYTTTDEMLKDLAEYYKDPKGLEQEYNKSECTPEVETAPSGGQGFGTVTLTDLPTRPNNTLERHHANDGVEQCDSQEDEGPDPTRR